MPRAGLSTGRVIEAAASLADELGYDGLTLTVLAERLGVAVPSLYKHVASLEALRIGVAVLALGELGSSMRAAASAASSDDSPTTMRAIARAYREYATGRPGCYAATIRAAGPTHPELAEAGEVALHTAYAALAELGLHGDEAIHAARAVRAALHGFAALESAGSFGLSQDVDQSFEYMMEALEHGLGSSASDQA